MTELGVNSCSSITFGDNSEEYIIPDVLVINPKDILDDKEGVYRISISKLKEPSDEATDALYQRLFSVLDKKKPFIDNIHIETLDGRITFKLAYVMKSERCFGTFYDIEAVKSDVEYIEGIT